MRCADAHDAALEGGCACGRVRYALLRRPMIVHACHCRWCQRETGSAFAVNALIEAHEVRLLSGTVERARVPSESGNGQNLNRCAACGTVLWSTYAAAREAVRFVRVGTLDRPDALPPDIHIYAASKAAWLSLPPGVPAFDGYYRRSEVWPAESVARYKAAKARIEDLDPALA